MRLAYGVVVALAALAAGCMSIGSDGPAPHGRLVPVGDDAADFTRAYGIALDEQAGFAEDARISLLKARESELTDKQSYHNQSAGAWNDARLLPDERQWSAVGYSALATESGARADRYTALAHTCETSIGMLTGQRATAERDTDYYDSMRLVAP